ncbi:hypothetical protein [Streptomyces sp. NPDC053048]|uniref:hypothetical protein n=1 Tax=Streptomyces sp. NPDC053048 TaxID=3365694 RepID=UPI0037D71968
MDLESAAGELFRLRPEEFTAARDRLVSEARRAGDAELARRLKALRRPTLAAWVSNLLVRERPEEAQALIGLGQGLRDAHRDLDGGQLRELSRRRRALVASMSEQARRLAGAAGHLVSDDVRREVEETLHAVLADEDAATEWATGRLTRPLAPVTGFPGVFPDAADRLAAPPAPSPAARERGTPARVTDLAAERERRRAREAEKQARVHEEEARRARREAERTEQAEEAARRRLDQLTAELGKAEERRSAAEERVREVQGRVREAERAWRAARRAAEAAAAEADRRG